ncbi:MAG: hypothetical protein WBA10_20255 [Elainellaceae cyanobacterium]
MWFPTPTDLDDDVTARNNTAFRITLVDLSSGYKIIPKERWRKNQSGASTKAAKVINTAAICAVKDLTFDAAKTHRFSTTLVVLSSFTARGLIVSSTFHQLRRTIATALCLAGLILGLVIPGGEAQAATTQAIPDTYASDLYSGRIQSMDQFDSAKLDAIEACLPEDISASNTDIGDRITQAFGEMGNDFLERAFNLKDDPTLSNSELAFRDCLQSKGVEFISPVE